jgi:hypothetical protein
VPGLSVGIEPGSGLPVALMVWAAPQFRQFVATSVIDPQ